MMRSQVSHTTVTTNSPQAPIRTRRRAQSVAVQGNSIQESISQRRVSLFESNVSLILPHTFAMNHHRATQNRAQPSQCNYNQILQTQPTAHGSASIRVLSSFHFFPYSVLLSPFPTRAQLPIPLSRVSKSRVAIKYPPTSDNFRLIPLHFDFAIASRSVWHHRGK